MGLLIDLLRKQNVDRVKKFVVRRSEQIVQCFRLYCMAFVVCLIFLCPFLTKEPAHREAFTNPSVIRPFHSAILLWRDAKGLGS